MIDKTVRMNYLYDFYAELLTEKQNQYMTMYYLDDWSLGEIAEHFSISRQAVYDNIRRTAVLLEEYENKLQLFEKYEGRKKQIQKMKQLLEQGEHPHLNEVVRALENLE